MPTVLLRISLICHFLNSLLHYFLPHKLTSLLLPSPCLPDAVKASPHRPSPCSVSFLATPQAMEPSELKRVFQMFDRNGDGRITKKELSDSLDNLGIFIPEGDLESMNGKIDVNGDSCVDIFAARRCLNPHLGTVRILLSTLCPESGAQIRFPNTSEPFPCPELPPHFLPKNRRHPTPTHTSPALAAPLSHPHVLPKNRRHPTPAPTSSSAPARAGSPFPCLPLPLPLPSPAAAATHSCPHFLSRHRRHSLSRSSSADVDDGTVGAPGQHLHGEFTNEHKMGDSCGSSRRMREGFEQIESSCDAS